MDEAANTFRREIRIINNADGVAPDQFSELLFQARRARVTVQDERFFLQRQLPCVDQYGGWIREAVRMTLEIHGFQGAFKNVLPTRADQPVFGIDSTQDRF